MQAKYSDLIKEIRSKNNENMGDMAKWLDVSLPFVSAVENGKKKIPDDWLEKISTHYSLNKKEQEELKMAILNCQTQIKIDLSLAGQTQKKLAIQFQRSFDNINDETAEKIFKILGGDN